MKILEMNETDRSLKLLAGDSFQVDNFLIEPVTLGEVKDIGYSLYNQYLGVMTFRVDDLIDTTDIDESTLSLFDLILSSGNPELIQLFIDSLCFFLKQDRTKINFHPDLGLIFGDINLSIEDVRVVSADNYNDILNVIKYQNYIFGKNGGDNPKNAKAKSIMEKLRKANEIVMKKKGAINDDKIDFSDLVSAVSTKSIHYDKESVWGLTMYQFYDEYKRLERISSYETNVLAMVNGAKIELKHWCGKLD